MMPARRVPASGVATERWGWIRAIDQRVGCRVCKRARSWLTIGAIVVLGSAGCSSSPNGGAAEIASRNFVNALRHGHGSAACRLLTDKARSSIAGTLDVSCSNAVTHVVERSDNIGSVQVWGDAAEVHIGADVLFLRLISGQWRVSAAGCTRQPIGPYECKVGS
jgi:hypothetical protein